MTDAPASPPGPEPPPSSSRLDASDAPWPLRPWIMAAICALAGVAFHLTLDWRYAADLDPNRQALRTAAAPPPSASRTVPLPMASPQGGSWLKPVGEDFE